MSKKVMVIAFDASGGVEAMCQENILPLGFLGEQVITRASELKWDDMTQAWTICVATSVEGQFFAPYPEAMGFPTYDDARDMEVEWFTECRRQGIHPQTDEGRAILQALRPEVCKECGATV